MWIIALKDKRDEGAYSVHDKHGNKVLFMFEQEDDAERYAMMLEEDGSEEMDLVEVDDDLALRTCKFYNYKYTIITPNDIVIPPKPTTK
tara:strand:+ start:120 stop:386 length:267 start_codon:yes stop_codon:yes gene_type:complete